MTTRNCPGCDAPMQVRSFERKPLGMVQLDLCFDCGAIWFDAFESAQLTPGAVIALFREIHEHDSDLQRPARERKRCPVCRTALARTFDMLRSQRIVYDRCLEGHGRFTSFLQFLREKEFVRELSLLELEKLRATVKQVRCSACGGNVDIARDPHCSYCGAAVSILDAQAVERALANLAESERNRVTVQPTAVMDALLAGQRLERNLQAIERRRTRDADLFSTVGSFGVVDLVGDALSMLMSD